MKNYLEAKKPNTLMLGFLGSMWRTTICYKNNKNYLNIQTKWQEKRKYNYCLNPCCNANGQIYISPDFDKPVDDFKEYMYRSIIIKNRRPM